MPVSLNGTATDTMSGMTVLDEEAQVRRQREEFLAQQAQAAQQAQQAAQQSYQQLAQAPPPQLSPADTFLPTLVGNIASTIAQDPGYRQRAETGIQTSRAALLKQRADNLNSQREVFNQSAEEAKAAGDLASREKYLGKIATLDKQLELVLANQSRADKKEAETLAHKRDLEKIRLAGSMRPGADSAEADAEIQATVDDLAEGRTEITQVPAKIRTTVQATLRKQGKRIMPKKVREALGEMDNASTVVEEIAGLSAQINTAKAGLLSRGIQGAKNVADALSQKGLAADLDSARKGLVANLSRAIASERGVLTNQDVNRALGLIPSLYDSQDLAERKIERLRRFIQSRRDNVLKRYTTAGAGTTPGGAAGGGGGGSVGDDGLTDEEAYRKYLKIRSGK